MKITKSELKSLIKEALKEELDRKPLKRRVRESIDSDFKKIDGMTVVPGTLAYPEFFAEEVEESNDWSESDLARSPVHKYYLDKGTSFDDLIVRKYFIPEIINVERWLADPGEYETYGFELNNGDYIYTCMGIQPVYIKCKNYNSMKNHVVNGDNFRKDIVE